MAQTDSTVVGPVYNSQTLTIVASTPATVTSTGVDMSELDSIKYAVALDRAITSPADAVYIIFEESDDNVTFVAAPAAGIRPTIDSALTDTTTGQATLQDQAAGLQLIYGQVGLTKRYIRASVTATAIDATDLNVTLTPIAEAKTTPFTDQFTAPYPNDGRP